MAMDAVDQHLYSPYGIHLLWPAFSKPDDDIGFVTRVYKGIKENAAIFSHPNPWAVIAECKLGRGERAMKFYDSLLPANQNDMIEIREAEPYSYCQFVMGRGPHGLRPGAASVAHRQRRMELHGGDALDTGQCG